MDLKRGIDLAVQTVIAELKSKSKKVTNNDEIAQVGTVSANGDAEIGKMIAEAMQKVGKEGVITVEEAKSITIELDVVEGMQFDRGTSGYDRGDGRRAAEERGSSGGHARRYGRDGLLTAAHAPHPSDMGMPSGKRHVRSRPRLRVHLVSGFGPQ